jgi:hypothetical protein
MDALIHHSRREETDCLLHSWCCPRTTMWVRVRCRFGVILYMSLFALMPPNPQRPRTVSMLKHTPNSNRRPPGSLPITSIRYTKEMMTRDDDEELSSCRCKYPDEGLYPNPSRFPSGGEAALVTFRRWASSSIQTVTTCAVKLISLIRGTYYNIV